MEVADMQVLAHNLLSQFTDRQLNVNTKNKSKSTERLSSGYRINRSADDAACYQFRKKCVGRSEVLIREKIILWMEYL